MKQSTFVCRKGYRLAAKIYFILLGTRNAESHEDCYWKNKLFFKNNWFWYLPWSLYYWVHIPYCLIILELFRKNFSLFLGAHKQINFALPHPRWDFLAVNNNWEHSIINSKIVCSFSNSFLLVLPCDCVAVLGFLMTLVIWPMLDQISAFFCHVPFPCWSVEV